MFRIAKAGLQGLSAMPALLTYYAVTRRLLKRRYIDCVHALGALPSLKTHGLSGFE